MLPGTFSRGNSSRTIAKASGKMPPATPWMTRATMSMPSELRDRGEQRAEAEHEQRPQQQSLLAVHVAEAADDRRAHRGREQEPVSSQVTPVSLACRSC